MDLPAYTWYNLTAILHHLLTVSTTSLQNEISMRLGLLPKNLAWPFCAKNGYPTVEAWPFLARMGYGAIGEWPFLAKIGHRTIEDITIPCADWLWNDWRHNHSWHKLVMERLGHNHFWRRLVMERLGHNHFWRRLVMERLGHNHSWHRLVMEWLKA